MTGTSEEDAADIIDEAGITCRSEEYNHVARTWWKTVEDGSCSSEAVSPILSGEEGLTEVRAVARALSSGGARINHDCGLHVHVDARDLSVKDIKNVVERYHAFESTIDTFMPRSRRGDSNEYCLPMSTTVDNSQYDDITNFNDISSFYFERQVKVNILSYQRHKSIEFRHHSGTLNGDKIVNWIKFCVNFVEQSREENMYTESTVTSTVPTVSPAPTTSSNVERTRVSAKFIKLAEYLRDEVGENFYISIERAKIHCGYSSVQSVKTAIQRLCANYGWAFEEGAFSSGCYLNTIGEIPTMQTPGTSNNRSSRHISRKLVKLATWFSVGQGHFGYDSYLANISGFSPSTIPAMVSKLRREYGFVIRRDRYREAYICYHAGTIPGINFTIDTAPAPTPETTPRTRISDDTWSRGLSQDIIAFYEERASDLAA